MELCFRFGITVHRANLEQLNDNFRFPSANLHLTKTNLEWTKANLLDIANLQLTMGQLVFNIDKVKIASGQLGTPNEIFKFPNVNLQVT
jgi:hypothetical protein